VWGFVLKKKKKNKLKKKKKKKKFAVFENRVGTWDIGWNGGIQLALGGRGMA